jgi:hypothetical protein
MGKAMTSSATVAKAALLLLLVVQVLLALGVLASAARPLAGDGTTMDGLLLDDGIGMVSQILGAAKSGPNPPSHCCN